MSICKPKMLKNEFRAEHISLIMVLQDCFIWRYVEAQISVEYKSDRNCYKKSSYISIKNSAWLSL